MRRSGNTILITGGSSGIGLALAKSFLKLNNKVIITGRDKNKLEQIKESIPEITTYCGDLTDSNVLESLNLFIEQHHPDLNILINNAGVQYNYSFLAKTNLNSKIEYEIATNITAPIQLTHRLLPIILKNKNTAIVNVSSGLFIAPKQSASVYCASKAAIHSFTKTLRYQLEHTETKVFELIPPLVQTSMTEGRGKSKISPEYLADEFMRNFESDKPEIYIGKTKLLKIISRFSPALADSIMKKEL